MDAKRTTVETKSKASSGAGALTIPGNAFRIAIILSIPAGATAHVIIGAGDGSNFGVQLNPNLPFLELTRDRYGDAVGAPITLVNVNAASIVFSWAEFLLAP